MSTPIENLGGYQAAHTTTAFYPQTTAGYLRISGPDRVNFIQRQTTNDARLLSPKHGLLTVLTSPTAHILDVLYLIQEQEAIGMITLPGLGDHTASFLKKRVFFMDKVTVENASNDFFQVDLIGPTAGHILAQLGQEKPLNTGDLAILEIGQATVSVLAVDPSFGLGYRLMMSKDHAPILLGDLERAGAEPISAEAYQILRVEKGLAEAGFELTEEFTPLETGLANAVSSSKGCYTGQEVIARQVTYDKVTQQLVGLKMEKIAKPGDRVWFDEKPVGVITSAIVSPTSGPIALAIVKRPHQEAGMPLKVGSRDDEKLAAVVASLPFC